MSERSHVLVRSTQCAVSVVAVANLYKQYKGAIPFAIARLMVGIDQYLTGDGQGSWNDDAPPPPLTGPATTDCPDVGSGRRLQAVGSFDSDVYGGAQPLINRPLLMSRTAGLSRSLWSLIISSNTFQRDRFERGTRYYYSPSLDWILEESGITGHGLDSTSAFIQRTRCDDSCVTAADDKCTDGGVFAEQARDQHADCWRVHA